MFSKQTLTLCLYLSKLNLFVFLRNYRYHFTIKQRISKY